ncbi:pilus assembly protein CpaE [Tissierella praeacuta DSM 18095]|uniref:Pilus assembly protein CpaE n=1 Tax=Tissierella praeacuta DSM 18095 TaxID=1123404 RepID=A0A1M4XIZ6_9FIRM|nr:P-loop NTPase [Tissierella praeacuta]TCU67840.1 pilus assembly protein CpaE [Tissierella praeacuta]SHE93479.1 pilus assembly protein CpaE [Tissierella praeacuta DSM 18095]SUP02074.1 Cell division inhibitor MinD [Tissierella praeacuta]
MEVKVLIFAEDSTSQRLFPLLQDDDIKIVGRVNDENKVLDTITKTRPDVILISSNNMNLLLRVCQQIYLLRPRSIPVVITDDYTHETIQKIMQTGVHYILPIQIDKSTLVAQIRGIQTNESARLMALENTSTTDWKSKVITVFSSKGGVGRTTVVTNLAIKLAQKKRKVAILDFDMEFGEVASSMRIETRDTISELLQEQSSPNADTIRKYMSMHSSGINILPAPSSPEFAEHISSSQIEKIISVLRIYYDYLIIDTSMGFNGINLSCFDASSIILYVTAMDLATLRRTKKGLSIVNSLVGNEKIQLLVAKEEPSRVKLRDVSKVLEFPLWHSIPFDHKMALEAVNQGRPMVMDSPTSKVSRGYQKIANELDQSDSPKEKKERTNVLGRFSRKNNGKKGDVW